MIELMLIAFLIGGGAWLSLLTLTFLYLVFEGCFAAFSHIMAIRINPRQIPAYLLIIALFAACCFVH